MKLTNSILFLMMTGFMILTSTLVIINHINSKFDLVSTKSDYKMDSNLLATVVESRSIPRVIYQDLSPELRELNQKFQLILEKETITSKEVQDIKSIITFFYKLNSDNSRSTEELLSSKIESSKQEELRKIETSKSNSFSFFGSMFRG